MRQSVSRTITGTGSGPMVGDLFDFMKAAPDDARLEIKNIPRDRPFDLEGWQITLRYVEEN